MATRDHITDFTAPQLDQLEKSAEALLNSNQHDAAASMLALVKSERARRAETKRLESRLEAEAIRERMRDRGLRERTVIAFSERPALPWEADMIKVLLDNPGATTEALSRAGGYKGAYMNWFGHVCRDREPWLGNAVSSVRSRDAIIYSSLLVDFVPRKDTLTGRTWTEWNLKPEAREAFEVLGIV